MNYEAGGVPTTSDCSFVLVDSVYYEKDGIITMGLPDGLTLVCEPTSCAWYPSAMNDLAFGSFVESKRKGKNSSDILKCCTYVVP